MKTYLMLPVLLAILVTGAGAEDCDQTELQGCITKLTSDIAKLTSNPEALCKGVRDAAKCVSDKLKDCSDNIAKGFNEQIDTQRANFEETCKDHGGTGGASSLAVAGGVVAVGVLLARIL